MMFIIAVVVLVVAAANVAFTEYGYDLVSDYISKSMFSQVSRYARVALWASSIVLSILTIL